MKLSSRIDRRRFLSLAAGTAAAGSLLRRLPASARPATGSLPVPDVWGNGELLAFSGIDGLTDYNDGLVARTVADPPALSIEWPTHAAVRFGSRRMGGVRITSDTFELATERGAVRGALIDAHHLLCEGPCEVDLSAGKLQSISDGARTLIGARAHFNPSLLHADLAQQMRERQSWLLRQAAPAGLDDRRLRTLSKALSVMKGQACTPEGLIRHPWTTPDRWPHRDLWLWDSVFHALGWHHLDTSLARAFIQAVFDGQQADGRMPHQLSPTQASSITQPPLLAFGVRALAGTPPDRAWIETLYPRLARYLEWDFAHRVAAGEGLAQWHIDGSALSRSGESGMDNSPRFDRAVGLDAVDFNVFLSQECAIMAEFAHVLGHADEAARWTARHHDLNRLINQRMWSDADGFYFDYDPAQKSQTGVFAVTGFLPLLCGAANESKVRRLAAQLHNPRTFATAVPLASAVLPPGTSQPQDMWRGPMWVNMNWLVALGFERCGRPDAALRLRQRTLAEVERWYLELGSLFEFYDQTGAVAPDHLPRKGAWNPESPYHQAVHDYGWTATLYTDLVYTLSGRPQRRL